MTVSTTPSTAASRPLPPVTKPTIARFLPAPVCRARRSPTAPSVTANTAQTAPNATITGIHAVATAMMPSTIADVATVFGAGVDAAGPSLGAIAVPSGSTNRPPSMETSAVHSSPLK